MALTAPIFAHFTSSFASPTCFARRSIRCWSRMIISGKKASPYCSATRISLGSAAAAATAVARDSTSAASRRDPRIRALLLIISDDDTRLGLTWRCSRTDEA